MITVLGPAVPPAPGPDESAIAFTGDVLLRPGAAKPILADEIAAFFRQSELVVGNLEAPVAEDADPIPKAGPHLRMTRQELDALVDLGFAGFGLANNHIGDHGERGVLDTLATCRNRNLHAFGAAGDIEAACRPAVLELPTGLRLALVAFCESEFGIATSTAAGGAPVSSPHARAAVREARIQADVVVVLAHGGAEDVFVPPPERRTQLRELVQMGADLVIGHHPHVPQGWERWGGGAIFYSLGDFLFDRGSDPFVQASRVGYAVRAIVKSARVERIEVMPHTMRAADAGATVSAAPDAREYLEELSAIVGGDRLDSVWPPVAELLWEHRYRRFLEFAFDMSRDVPGGRLTPLRRVIRSFRAAGSPTQALESERDRTLLLEVLVRCESHRWTLTAGLEGLTRSGSHPPRLTEEARRLLDMSAFPPPLRGPAD